MKINLLIFLTLTFTTWAFIYVLYEKIKEMESKRIERENKQNKWLFDSLYSMSSKVMLPEEYEEAPKKKESLAAKVFYQDQDPMYEMNGLRDDWFGKGR